MAVPFENRRDAQRAYISRQEAHPITDAAHDIRKSHRDHVNRLTFGTDGTRFPHEPDIDILPSMDRCFPGGYEKGTIIDEQKSRNARLDKEMRLKIDLFKVFSPKRMGPPPGWL